MDFNGYSDFIEENMPPEAPGLFGLHPNAEIGYLTSYTEMICFTVIVLSGGGGGSSGGDESGGGSTGVRRTLASLAGQIPERFKLLALNDKAEPLLSTLTTLWRSGWRWRRSVATLRLRLPTPMRWR